MMMADVYGYEGSSLGSVHPRNTEAVEAFDLRQSHELANDNIKARLSPVAEEGSF